MEFEKVKEYATELGNLWTNCRSKWMVADTVVAGAYKIEVPEWGRAPKTTPPTPSKMLRFGTAQLISIDPEVYRMLLDDSEDSVDLMRKVTKWAELTISAIGRNAKVNLWRTLYRHLLLYGYAGAYGPIPEARLWNEAHTDFANGVSVDSPEWKRRMLDLNPFSVEAPHPSHILMDGFAGERPDFGILHTYYTADHLIRNYPKMDRNKLPKQRFAWVPCYIYADLDEVSMWVAMEDGANVYKTENRLGYVPFTQAFSGLGMDKAELPSGSEGHYADSLVSMSEGLLDPSISSLIAEGHAATYEMESLWNQAYQTLLVREGDVDLNELGAQPVLEVEDTEKSARYLETPQLPPNILSIQEARRSEAEHSTLSPVISGQRVRGTTTASQHAQQSASARLLYDIVTQELNDMGSVIIANCARTVVSMDHERGLPITIYGWVKDEPVSETIKASDLQDDFNFRVKFEAADPAQKMAEQEMAIQQRGNQLGPEGGPAMSFETYAEKMGLDPGKEVKALQKEKMRAILLQDPMIVQTIARMASEKAGFPITLGGGGPEAGGPGVPNVEGSVVNAAGV